MEQCNVLLDSIDDVRLYTLTARAVVCRDLTVVYIYIYIYIYIYMGLYYMRKNSIVCRAHHCLDHEA